jgi:signal transduction histidine kinase/ActR/RegA family two-component response regulator
VHRLLRRQLLRHYGSLDDVPEELAALVESVDQAYQQADDDRALLERSLDLTSQELLQRNAELREDIAGREAAEVALRESEAQTKAILHALPDVVFLLAADRTLLDCHAPANGALGIDERAVIGRKVCEVMPKAFCDELVPRLQRMSESGEIQQWDMSLRGPEGPRYLEVRVRQCEGESMLVVVRDVTDKQKMQDRLSIADRMASVGTLAAGVAHEINNPLTYVLANVDIVLEALGELDPRNLRGAGFDVLQALEEAVIGAQRVKEIVRDLKSFSRNQSEEMTAVDLNTALRAAINMASNEIRHRARLTVSSGNIPRAHANEARIRQVLLNLLVNAAQSMPIGEALDNRISARTFERDDYIGIEIADTGTGIPDDVLPRIFDPFFTTKPIGEGTGLGLSICHNLVTAMGGDIVVDSSERGTTFTVRLQQAHDEPIAATARTSQEPVPKARVLVIDDDVFVASSVARVLDNCEVTVTTSGRDGLRYLDGDTDFDVVLCDVMMPEMSGVEVYEHLRATNSNMLSRLVFMTGGTFSEREREFIARASNEILEKPFDSDALKDIVRHFHQRGEHRRAATSAE